MILIIIKIHEFSFLIFSIKITQFLQTTLMIADYGYKYEYYEFEINGNYL